jgi:hypothetical protein
MVTNPLEKFLGAYQSGTYKQTKLSYNYAFVQFKDLWTEDVDNNSNDQTTESNMQTSQQRDTTPQQTLLYQPSHKPTTAGQSQQQQEQKEPKKTYGSWSPAHTTKRSQKENQRALTVHPEVK